MTKPFHAGELEMQRRAGAVDEARDVGRIIGNRVPTAAARFLERQRVAVAASLDRGGRVWASLLTGPPGFVTVVDDGLLHLAGRPADGDPLPDNLRSRPQLGLLVIDLATRQRMRFNGRALDAPEGIFLSVDQVYGNCPKYIQRRSLEAEPPAATGGPPIARDALDDRQQEWIAGADTFFIASAHPDGGADASHRGGFPGFVRVLGPERLAFDDYPGNGMFNTLGNLAGPSGGGPAVRGLRERRRAPALRPRRGGGGLLGRGGDRGRARDAARQPAALRGSRSIRTLITDVRSK